MSSSPAPPTPARPLGRGAAQLAGWLAVAAVNTAAFPLTVPMPHGGVRVRLLAHLYDVGQLAAAGFLSWGASALVSRATARLAFARTRAGELLLGPIALALVAGLAGARWLAPDLAGAAARASSDVAAAALLAGMIAGAALGLGLLALAGRLLARRRLRIAGVVLGLALAATSHAVLRSDYPGVHLYLAWAGATLAGASLAGARGLAILPGSRARLAVVASLVALGLGALASLVVPPSSAVAVELFSSSGAVIAPLLVEARDREAGAPEGALAAVWPGPGPRPDVPPSSPRLVPADAVVVFIIVDCLRADVLAGEARDAPELPNLQALRRDSVDFASARSAASATLWSLSTIFTGKYYSSLYWSPLEGHPLTRVYPHRDATPRFPEVLSASGVRTIAVHQMIELTRPFGVLRGIDEEHHHHRKDELWAENLTDSAIDGLREHPLGPKFLYLHYLDAHGPADRVKKDGSPRERYLAELGLVDEQVGRLRAAITEAGLDKRASIIVAADHGEAFGEHGTEHHSVSVYEELLRVPLLIHVPGVAARRVTTPVSLVDVGPTILDLMGRPTPGASMGQSLVPFLRGQDPKLERPLVADTGRRQQAMIFDDGFKVLRDRRRGTVELYDLRRDPGELENLADGPGLARRDDALRAFFEVHTLKRPGYRVPYRK